MKRFRTLLIFATLFSFALSSLAQVESAGGVRRRTAKDKKKQQTAGTNVTERMQSFFETTEPSDADLSYLREIYRQIDLSKKENAPLYFPEDIIDGQENLFRIMLRLVVDGELPAYEYLDGREVFTDKYQINVAEMLDRFGIYYNGSGKKITIEEADVPTTQVLNYYIIEKWEFDKRSNRMKARVVAICPVLNRYGDYGGEAKYPMFWVKYDQLRPYLASQYIFTSDDNNLPQYSLDDYFNMGMYEGEIYKTRNLRNLSMAQMFPDEDDRKRAQDSIDNRLRSFGKDLWVPSREEFLAMKEKEAEREAEAEAKAAAGDSIPERTVVSADEEPQKKVSSRSKKRSSTKKRAKKPKQPKVKSSSSSSQGNSNAAKSVRRRRR